MAPTMKVRIKAASLDDTAGTRDKISRVPRRKSRTEDSYGLVKSGLSCQIMYPQKIMGEAT